MNLDIHLNGSDTLRGARHLEIHVPEEILQSLDIRQQHIIIIRLPCDQSAGNTGNHPLDGNSCRHQ